MMKKAPIVQDIFQVKEKVYITPHYIRIILTGNVGVFKDAVLGDNNKIFVPPNGAKKVQMRYFDEAKQEWILPSKDVLPHMRTYTHRAIDLNKKELSIDFVDHGDSGPASSWARNAETGDELGVAMKLNNKELFPKVEWYMLVGDATAIPVLSVILEGLPATAKGICIIEVHGEEDKQSLKTDAEIEFIWMYNAHSENGSKLSFEVKKVEIPEGSKFGFVACELNSVKEIRTYLRKEMGWLSQELYAFSYWKSGVSEDKSSGERQKEKEVD